MRVDSLQFRLVLSSVSTLALVPYLLGGIAIVPALITAACAIAMAVIVFRIASARMQFIGENPRDEYALYPLSLLWKM